MRFGRVSQIECDNSGRPPSTECLQYHIGDSGTFQVRGRNPKNTKGEKSLKYKQRTSEAKPRKGLFNSEFCSRAGTMMDQKSTTQPRARL